VLKCSSCWIVTDRRSADCAVISLTRILQIGNLQAVAQFLSNASKSVSGKPRPRVPQRYSAHNPVLLHAC